MLRRVVPLCLAAITTVTLGIPGVSDAAEGYPSKAVIASQRDNAATSESDVVIGRLDGSGEYRVAGATSDWSPAFSPDGRWLAFTRYDGTGADIWVTSVAGGEARRITTAGNVATDWPAWSPDGRRIAFSLGHWTQYGFLGRKIAVVDVATGAVQELTSGWNDLLPVWSPDGSRIVFTSRPGIGNEDDDLYVVAFDGTAPRRLTGTDHDGEVYHPGGWSADGQRILAIHQTYNGSHVVILNADGTGERIIASDTDRVQGNKCSGTLLYPSWSPDERWVLYNGCTGLRIVSSDGRTDKPLDPADPAQWRYKAVWMPNTAATGN